MSSPFDPVTFRHGPAMANRLMLATLTNTQSHADGRLSDEELPSLQTERFGIRTAHIVEVYESIVGSGQVDLMCWAGWSIMHHDYPQLLARNEGFVPRRPPVCADVLVAEGGSPKFVTYLSGSFKGFVDQS